MLSKKIIKSDEISADDFQLVASEDGKDLIELEGIPKSDDPASLLDFFNVVHKKDIAENEKMKELEVNREPVNEGNIEAENKSLAEAAKERLRLAIQNDELEKLSLEELAAALEIFFNIQPLSAADILEQKILDKGEVCFLLMEKEPLIPDATRLEYIKRLIELFQKKKQSLTGDDLTADKKGGRSEILQEVLKQFNAMNRKDFFSLLMTFQLSELSRLYDNVENATADEQLTEITQVELMRILNSVRIKKSNPFKILKFPPKAKPTKK